MGKIKTMILELTENEMRGQKPNIPMIDGVLLAGGSIRAWFCGDEKVSDYDLFFKDINTLETYRQTYLKDCKVTRDEEFIYECIWNNKKIQLIKRVFPQTVQELFDRFDYHLCQFAQSTTGIWATKEAIISVLRKNLSYNNKKNLGGYELDTLRRAFKYARKGYWPCMGCLTDLAKSFQKADVNIDAQSEFYPDGKTKRILKFD